jgi:hypothetical protein
MTDASPAGVPAPSLLARVVGVIFSPRDTFERIAAHPRVLGVLLISGVAIGLAQGLPQFTEGGAQAALDAQVERTESFTGQPVTDQQYARMQQMLPVTTYTTMVLSPVGLAAGLLVFTGIYFVLFNVVLGGTATFKQVFAVVAHASVISALGTVLGAPVQHLQGTVDSMGPFTLRALLPTLGEASFAARFLGFVGVFTIWSTLVTAIGLSVLYRRKTSNIAIALFALTALFAAIGATVMGFFSGR